MRLAVHPSQYPGPVRARLEKGLRELRLPGRFLYDSWAQANRWLAYHGAYSPSRIDSSTEAAYDAAYEAALDGMTPGFRHVSLGCGGGTKDHRLLSAARPNVGTYMPIDTSPTLVVESALRNRTLVSAVDPWVMDLEEALSPEAFGSHEEPRLFTAFGMVPNFELADFGDRLRRWLRTGDRIAISFNLSPGPQPEAAPRIVPQYDNAPGRAWMTGALSELGLSVGAYELRFEARTLGTDGETWQVVAWADPHSGQAFQLPHQRIEWPAGRPLRVLISNRLTARAARAALEAWDLAIEWERVDALEEEGVWVARRV